MSVYAIVKETVRLSDTTRKRSLREPLIYNNKRATAFRVEVLNENFDGPADMTGVGVTGKFLRKKDNTTVLPILGTVSGNVCEVILPGACYSVSGRFTFTMDLTQSSPTTGVPEFSTSTNYAIGDRVVYNSAVWVFTSAHTAGAWNANDVAADVETRSVLIVEGVVEAASSDSAIDPGSPITSVDQAIANANSAASSANTAASAATTAAEQATAAATGALSNLAPAFAQATANAAGTYVTYTDGKLYYLPSGHTANTTWSNTTKTEVTVGAELADLNNQTDGIQSAVATKAEQDGSYEQMTVGNAEQLVATVGITDKVPYNFRTSGGSADIGNRETDMLVGGTIAWNQLFDKANFAASKTDHEVVFTNNGDGSVTASGTASEDRAVFSLGNIITVADHVYLYGTIEEQAAGYWIGNSTYGTASGMKYMYKQRSSGAVGFNIMVASGATVNRTFWPKCFDLTQMFGTTIADYIYGLETATPGAGVAWFRKLFPKDYYAYDAGSLQSVQAKSHEMVGFNAWDEEWELGIFNYETGAEIAASNQIRSKNYIPVVPNTTYYIKIPGSVLVLGYDANKNFLGRLRYNSGNATFLTRTLNGDDCYYIRFCTMDTPSYGNTYNHDICINLSWSGYRNGEYEPYVKKTYALDPDLTLRGIPKLDANHALYYDGDTYQSDGTVTRRYGVVSYTGTETGWMWYGQYNQASIALPAAAKYEASTISYNANRLQPVCNPVRPTYIGNYASLVSSGELAAFSAPGCDTLEKFKTWVANNGLTFVYELATPTTEIADPYQNPQIVDDFGTEEYVDAGVTASTPTRDVAIPVGHETYYMANLRDKLQHLPEPTGTDGEYIISEASEQMRLVPALGSSAVFDLIAAMMNPVEYWEEGGTVTAGDLTIVRNGAVTTISGTASANVYVHLNGYTAEAATGNWPDTWQTSGHRMPDGGRRDGASIAWCQSQAVNGVDIGMLDGVMDTWAGTSQHDAIPVAGGTAIEVGHYRGAQDTGNEGQAFVIYVANGTVLPAGYSITAQIVGGVNRES